MIRNLKVLLAAALALTALGAIAQSAHAADEFHCSVTPCRLTAKPDGNLTTEGKTAHQVFIVQNATKTESVSFTCEQITGHARYEGKTTTQITLTSIVYHGCTVNGSPGLVVDMNNCDYLFTAAGGTKDEAEVHVVCETGKKIEMTIPGGCIFSIGDQRVKGIGYHNVPNDVGPERQVTVTGNIPGITVERNAACESLIKATALTGSITTGNAIVTGETDPEAGTPVMAEAWYL